MNIRELRKNNDKINVVKNEKIKVEFMYAPSNSNKFAPIIRGMDRRNENLAAFSLSIPWYKATDIVIPLLETPGNNARVWNKPIISEFKGLSFLFSGFMNLVNNKTNPVRIKEKPINSKELNFDSIKLLNKKPIKAAGKVAIVKNSHILFDFLKASNSLISFLVNIITAAKEARCKTEKKNKSGFEK